MHLSERILPEPLHKTIRESASPPRGAGSNLAEVVEMWNLKRRYTELVLYQEIVRGGSHL